jgi:hypothetical protein
MDKLDELLLLSVSWALHIVIDCGKVLFLERQGGIMELQLNNAGFESDTKGESITLVRKQSRDPIGEIIMQTRTI